MQCSPVAAQQAQQIHTCAADADEGMGLGIRQVDHDVSILQRRAKERTALQAPSAIERVRRRPQE